jgi:hypothetical protein
VVEIVASEVSVRRWVKVRVDLRWFCQLDGSGKLYAKAQTDVAITNAKAVTRRFISISSEVFKKAAHVMVVYF